MKKILSLTILIFLFEILNFQKINYIETNYENCEVINEKTYTSTEPEYFGVDNLKSEKDFPYNLMYLQLNVSSKIAFEIILKTFVIKNVESYQKMTIEEKVSLFQNNLPNRTNYTKIEVCQPQKNCFITYTFIKNSVYLYSVNTTFSYSLKANAMETDRASCNITSLTNLILIFVGVLIGVFFLIIITSSLFFFIIYFFVRRARKVMDENYEFMKH
jgi:hypothetical protein